MTKMITRVLLIFLMGAWLLVMASCTKLDEKPVGIIVPENFFQNEADAESAVFGSYSLLASEQYYGRRLSMVLQLLGDDCDIADIGTQSSRIQLNSFVHDANNQDLGTVWTVIYLTIGAANSAIDGIPNVDMAEDRKAALIAEARLVRALGYYHLVQLFGDIPYLDGFVTDPNEVADISKTPAAEVYGHIIADCEAGIAALPDTYANNVRSRVTKGSAQTLLASTYLAMGDFEQAAEHAKAVIAKAADYRYALTPDYKDLWNADLGNQNEHVWTVDFSGGITGPYSTGSDYGAPMTGVRDADMQGWSVIVPSDGMFNSFNDNDYRKSISFLTETPVNGVMTPYTRWRWPRIHTAKWCLFPGAKASADGGNSDINYVVFRYAEVLLMAAEAINETEGPTAEAYEYINAVRQRARGSGTYPADLASGLSQAQFREAVREERRVELAFEWKRWYDLKRWDIIVESFTGADAYEKQANVREHHKLMPIPQTELIRNPNLLPQNTGY